MKKTKQSNNAGITQHCMIPEMKLTCLEKQKDFKKKENGKGKIKASFWYCRIVEKFVLPCLIMRKTVNSEITAQRIIRKRQLLIFSWRGAASGISKESFETV